MTQSYSLLLGYGASLIVLLAIGALLLKTRDDIPDWLAGVAILMALFVASLV